jgi:AbrB family looped-hinge helix DNA binding protein
MRTTIDKAGRIVLPKALRDQVGIVPGEVEVTISGAGLHIEPAEYARLVEKDGLLMLPATGVTMSGDELREFRLADQR